MIDPSMRDAKTKQSLVDYLEKNPSERLFQAISNWSGIHYLGSAIDPSGNGFRDLFHLEADSSDRFKKEQE